MNIGHVARVHAARSQQAVLAAIGIEVSAGRFGRWLAMARLVHVERVGALGPPVDADMKKRAVRRRGQSDGADLLSIPARRRS